MPRRAPFVPDGVPVLSRGRHRSPRKGACFMEMASFLAGERWSDHPTCTHPVLATVARCVNDMLDDSQRQRLLTMIPEVVGLNPDDPRATTALLLTAARAALPVAAQERQNVMALAILNAERVLARQDGRSPIRMSEASCVALATAPAAERWAREHLAGMSSGSTAMPPSSAARVAAVAVDCIARAWVEDRQERLVRLLRDGIDVMAAFSPLVPDPVTVSWPAHDPAVRQETPTRKARHQLP
ncbi:hypothetical protein GCM10009740_35130 [Terrabacter terrae]|uniref:MftR C-terminal domain-containing protein n=1 Tax=Terrabacter terrae TaxID=318434 RepID=A0ABN2UMB8_9MICO